MLYTTQKWKLGLGSNQGICAQCSVQRLQRCQNFHSILLHSIFATREPPKGVSLTPNSITFAAAAPNGDAVMLNPAGVTMAASPDQPAMTVRFPAGCYGNMHSHKL